MIRGFKEFILRGNVIDLAVAFVAGAAFNSVIGAFSKAFINPMVGLLLGGGLDVGVVTIRDQVFDFSLLINALISFVLTMMVLYFVFVVPMNKIRTLTGEPGPRLTPVDQQIKLLREIRDELKGAEKEEPH